MAIGAKYRCPECGLALSDPNADCSYCAKHALESESAAQSDATTSQPASGSLLNRYRDAYSVALALVGFGATIKFIGVAVGLLLAVAGALSLSDGILGVALIIGGVVLAIPVYVLGVLVSAQGQILRASLDTAVNTSPLLSDTDKRQAIGVH